MSVEMIEYVTPESPNCPFTWEYPQVLSQATKEELDEWNVKSTIDWYEIEVTIPPAASPKEPDIAEEFAALVSEWKEATWSISMAKRRIVHPAYLKIIGMGPVAIPLLLKELKREPDIWHYALESITRQNPVPKDADMIGVLEAWLQWGERRGYCDLRRVEEESS